MCVCVCVCVCVCLPYSDTVMYSKLQLDKPMSRALNIAGRKREKGEGKGRKEEREGRRRGGNK